MICACSELNYKGHALRSPGTPRLRSAARVVVSLSRLFVPQSCHFRPLSLAGNTLGILDSGLRKVLPERFAELAIEGFREPEGDLCEVTTKIGEDYIGVPHWFPSADILQAKFFLGLRNLGTYVSDLPRSGVAPETQPAPRCHPGSLRFTDRVAGSAVQVERN